VLLRSPIVDLPSFYGILVLLSSAGEGETQDYRYLVHRFVSFLLSRHGPLLAVCRMGDPNSPVVNLL